MQINKPKFWDSEIGIISILLLPLSMVVITYIFLKKFLCKKTSFKIPVVCVGNIYVGGTGKTPTSIFLANELSKQNINSVILRKFYKSHQDEHNLIRKNFNNLILCNDRLQGLNEAVKSNYNIAILDDGLQDYKIKKNLSIVCFNHRQLIGNGFVFPSGPLRENLSSLKNAQIVLINGEKNENFENKILKIKKNLKIFYSYYKPLNIEKFKNTKLLAISGIGNPENFFQLIEQNGLNIEKKIKFPDHYLFSETEIKNIIKIAEDNGLKIIMTEKDYFRIKDFKLNNLNFLEVSLEIKEKDKLIEIIQNLNENN